VLKPGPLPYRSGMNVLDAILAVGGLTQFAAGNRSKIIRRDKNPPLELSVKLDRLVNQGDMSQNLPLQPGDVLVVPQSLF
jgi:polysaccharide export outer membrane protein